MNRVTLSFSWPFTSDETREVLSFSFRLAIITYLGLILIERFRPGAVSTFFQIDYFFWTAIVTGALSMIWPVLSSSMLDRTRRIGWVDMLWLGVLSVATVVAVWSRISSIGWLARFIAPLCGLFVFGLSLLVYYERDDSTSSG